jgi:hypothetical protein
MTAYRVVPYDIETLVALLAELSTATTEAVSAKAHRQYFEGYFAHLEARTVVVEQEYVDHDYLEDYAAYYVKCFVGYRRWTSRLHFFRNSFGEAEFRSLLAGESGTLVVDQLQRSYLGFVVVKPLPQTIVGRTCLATYPDDNLRRHFPITQTYQASLFGIALRVESLAFQEQDSVVAACATSALWSCFQGTGKLFQHSIPSPVEITKAAAVAIPHSELPQNARALPNSGLTTAQMAQAVKSVGLEPYIVGAVNRHVLNGTVYAYLRSKIPTILGISLQDWVGERCVNEMGKHAVAVTGFSLGLPAPEPEITTGFLLRASRIDRLYEGEVRAIPTLLLLPLYNKIRIPYAVVHDTVLAFDQVLELFRTSFAPAVGRFEWDIYLSTANSFKEGVFTEGRGLLKADAEKILTRNMPRFLWRATARIGEDPYMELVFDATGIEQQELVLFAVEFKPTLRPLITAIASSGVLPSLLAASPFARQVVAIFASLADGAAVRAAD